MMVQLHKKKMGTMLPAGYEYQTHILITFPPRCFDLNFPELSYDIGCAHFLSKPSLLDCHLRDIQYQLAKEQTGLYKEIDQKNIARPKVVSRTTLFSGPASEHL